MRSLMFLFLAACGGTYDLPSDAGDAATDATPDAPDPSPVCRIPGAFVPCDASTPSVDCSTCPQSCTVNGTIGDCTVSQ